MGGIIDIDKYAINRVREIRTAKKISQQKLSILIGFSEGFIGNVENPNRKEKYNLRHLNLIAKALNCSPKDFLPEQPI